jgi:hypothetical protein
MQYSALGERSVLWHPLRVRRVKASQVNYRARVSLCRSDWFLVMDWNVYCDPNTFDTINRVSTSVRMLLDARECTSYGFFYALMGGLL